MSADNAYSSGRHDAAPDDRAAASQPKAALLQNGDSARGRLLTWLLVSGAFIGVSLLSVPVPGVNEPHYLTKAKAFSDPTWCANDFFLQSGNAHAVFFAVVGQATRLLSFHTTIFIGRIISLLLLGWGWSMLGRQLSLNSVGTILAACGFCLIAMTGNFSGEWVVGGFESKVPAYGCALATVAFWLQAWRSPEPRRYAVAGVMAGLAVSWHPVVGLWFCIGIAATEMILARVPRGSFEPTPRYRLLLCNGLTFFATSLLFALPGLIPAVQVVMESDLPIGRQDRANFIQVYWRLAHHLDPGTFSVRNWLHTAVLSGVCLTGLVRLRRQNHALAAAVAAAGNSGGPRKRSAWLPMVVLLTAAALTAAAGVAVGWHSGAATEIPDWQWRAKLLKFYPFRFFDALLPMTTALVLAVLIVRSVPARLQQRLVLVVLVATMSAALQKRPAAPTAYSRQAYSTWQQACAWLKDNTPAESVIYGPREGFGLKLFAERAEYVCFKDCPQDADGILEWNRRLWMIYYWSEAAYQDGLFDDTDLRQLRQKTGVTHIITRRLGPFERRPVWKNGVWQIYETGE